MVTPIIRKSNDIIFIGNKSKGKTITMIANAFMSWLTEDTIIFTNLKNLKFPTIYINSTQDFKIIEKYPKNKKKKNGDEKNMKMLEKAKKLILVALTLATILFSGASAPSIVASNSGAMSIGLIIIGAISIFVLVNILPEVANQTADAISDTATDSKTDAMLGLLPWGLAVLGFVGLFSAFI